MDGRLHRDARARRPRYVPRERPRHQESRRPARHRQQPACDIRTRCGLAPLAQLRDPPAVGDTFRFAEGGLMMQTKLTLYSTTRPTPVGELTLVASDAGLRAILWPRLSPARAGIQPRPRRNPDHPILKLTASQLDEYFAGRRTTFDIPLDLQGTRFQLAAWRSLAGIPFGTTTSYGRQAAALGIPTAARALGAANGAGKPSTMRMIGCVSSPSAGTLRVLGMDPDQNGPRIRARLGVVPQSDTLDVELHVDENLLTYARYFGIRRDVAKRRAEQLLDFVQLRDRARDEVEFLSGGMKRRLTIARALVNEPELLLLDEPTTGLDPQARHLVWDRLYRLKQQGVTIVLTTHYMDEAEQLCDRLVVMDKAKIVAFGSPRSLIDQYSSREVLELRFPVDTTPALDKLDGLADRIEALPDRVLLYTGDGEAAAVAVHNRGLRPESTLVRRSTLEDVFLRLTGRSLIE